MMILVSCFLMTLLSVIHGLELRALVLGCHVRYPTLYGPWHTFHRNDVYTNVMVGQHVIQTFEVVVVCCFLNLCCCLMVLYPQVTSLTNFEQVICPNTIGY